MNLNNINSDSLIPFDWEIKKIKYIAEVNTGSTPSTSKEEFYKDGDTLWVKPGNLNNFLPIINTDQKLSDAGLKISKELKENSSLVCGIGDIGKFGFSEEKVTTNQQIHGITFNEKFMIAKYGIYVISSLQEILKKESEKVVVSILTKRKLELIKVIVPPLVEQKLISQYLDKKTSQINSLVEKIEKKIELLNEQKTALIDQYVTKGLEQNAEMKDSGIDCIGEIPKHWEVKPIKYIAEITLGKMLTPNKKENMLRRPYLRSLNIQENNLNLEDINHMWFSRKEIDKFALKKKDILVNEGGEVGRPCILKDDIFETGFQNSINRIRVHNENPDYVYLVVYLCFKRGYYDSIVNRVSIPHLTKEKLENCLILVPPLQEQRRIKKEVTLKFEQISEIIKLERKRILYLKEYKKSLIYEVVTGKKRVV